MGLPTDPLDAADPAEAADPSAPLEVVRANEGEHSTR